MKHIRKVSMPAKAQWMSTANAWVGFVSAVVGLLLNIEKLFGFDISGLWEKEPEW